MQQEEKDGQGMTEVREGANEGERGGARARASERVRVSEQKREREKERERQRDREREQGPQDKTIQRKEEEGLGVVGGVHGRGWGGCQW